MSTLSKSLEDLSKKLELYERDGAVLTPDAVNAIARFMRQAARDAAKIERMLERRLTASGFARLKKSNGAVEAMPEAGTPNIVLFRPRQKPSQPSGGDAA